MTDDGIAGTGIKLGITLYSLTSEFAAGLYTPETLIKAVADEGLGPGVEFNIAQLLRTYPDVDDDFVRLWRDSIERYGLEPSAIGTNLDMGRRKDRDMTPDEEHDFLARQLKTAHTLGFKRVVIRSHGKELLRSLLPLAEQYDQQLGYEIHAPSGPNDPHVLQIREMYDELQSERLGFTADFSSTMHSLSPTLLRQLSRMGLEDRHFPVMDEIWHEPTPMHVRNQQVRGLPARRGRRPDRVRPVHAPGLQHARARAAGGVARHHAADLPRAREVLRHRRRRPGAGHGHPAHRAPVRAGRVPGLPLERVGGPRVPGPRRGRPDRPGEAAARADAVRHRRRPSRPSRPEQTRTRT